MTKKDNDILARDLVLAAFIVMKRQYESRDAGRAGKLQMFLNIHAGTHGDVKNIVAILNNPKSTVKLSEDQQRIYQRALDIVESLQGVEEGWTERVFVPRFDTTGIDLDVQSKELLRRINIDGLAPFEIEAIQGMLEKMRAEQPEEGELPEPDEEDEDDGLMLSEVSNEELIRRAAIANGKIPSPNPLGIPLSGTVEMTPEQAQPAEQPKAKPGRKKNPIEAATTNAKKKGKACCN